MKPIITIMEQIMDTKYRTIEDAVMTEIVKFGICVDKDRLIQALQDAHKFYNEGYEDGKHDAVQRCEG